MQVPDYGKLKGDMHDDFSRSANPVRSWFHRSRFRLVRKLVEKYSEIDYPNFKVREDNYPRINAREVVVDLACGSASWNENNRN